MLNSVPWGACSCAGFSALATKTMRSEPHRLLRLRDSPMLFSSSLDAAHLQLLLCSSILLVRKSVNVGFTSRKAGDTHIQRLAATAQEKQSAAPSRPCASRHSQLIA